MTSSLRRSQALLVLLAIVVGVATGSGYLANASASPLADKANDVAAAVAERDAVRAELADARATLHGLQAELDEARLRRDELRAQIEQRLVALYTQGHSSTTAAALLDSITGESSITDTAYLIRQLGEHEQGEIEDWQKLRRNVERLEREGAALEERIDTLVSDLDAARDQLATARRELAAAEAEARAAAAEAVRRAAEVAAAAQNQPPLPAPVLPQKVVLDTAEQATAQAESESALAAGPAPAPSGYVEHGVASWYGDEFAGRTTANGEVFDPGAMTAAHPHLAFGTLVRVTGPGGSTIVRINDRGPEVAGRIIDLSQAAAAAIGVTSTAEVTVTVLS